jgi:hypothetical protein
MIPQTRAGAHAPSCPGGGGARPARNWPCGLKPPDRGAWYAYVADIDIDGARGPEREKNKLAQSTRMR